jgi:hypothetical protein
MNKRGISLMVAAMVFSTTVAAEGWSFGIGTGISALDVDGVGGFDTASGPVEFDASMKPDDMNEYAESAFGFGGFAKKGDVMITYSVGQLELQDDVSVEQGGNTGEFEITFTTAGAEVLAHYTFSRSEKTAWGVIGGVRYTSQEYEGELTINNTVVSDSSVDDEWTDAVVGLSHAYAFSPTTSWSTQVDVSSGDSEGTSHFNTGINWIYGENWVFRASVDVKQIEFQQGDPGDSDYFLYDADETKLGGSFSYVF